MKLTQKDLNETLAFVSECGQEILDLRRQLAEAQGEIERFETQNAYLRQKSESFADALDAFSIMGSHNKATEEIEARVRNFAKKALSAYRSDRFGALTPIPTPQAPRTCPCSFPHQPHNSCDGTSQARPGASGEVVEGVQCRACFGSGSVEIQSGPYFRECRDCGGSGKVVSLDAAPKP